VSVRLNYSKSVGEQDTGFAHSCTLKGEMGITFILVKFFKDRWVDRGFPIYEGPVTRIRVSPRFWGLGPFGPNVLDWKFGGVQPRACSVSVKRTAATS